MDNKKSNGEAFEKKNLAETFLRMALPSNKMALSEGEWLPSPEDGEHFDDWARRAGKSLAQAAATCRAQGGRWRVGAAIKSVGEAALAATCGYALSATVIWRLKMTGGNAEDVEAPITEASWCGEFFFDISKARRVDKAIDAALWGDSDPPTRWAFVKSRRFEALRGFSEVALAIVLGVVAAPIGWAGLAIAQHPLRQRGLILAADALDEAARMMSGDEMAKGFGPRELAMAGWLRACRVAKALGANVAQPMMAALACRALSLPGEPLEAIPDVEAEWIENDRELPIQARSKEDVAKALAELSARLSGGKSEAHVAMTALWTLRAEAEILEGSEDAKATWALMAHWWRDAEKQCFAKYGALAPALTERMLANWLGMENSEQIIASSRAKSFGDLPEQEGELLGSEKLARWAMALRAMQDEQHWPESMRRQVAINLVASAIYLERPRERDASLADDGEEADKKVELILKDIGARFTAAAAPLALSPKEMAESIGEALAKSSPWSKKIASEKNFKQWGWGGIMANAEPIFNELKVDWEAGQISESLAKEPNRGQKTSKQRL